jgi:PAS domain S-box-containing protein
MKAGKMKKKPIQVLLIEDNPGDVRLIREFLREDGLDQFALIQAERLEAGLKLVSQDKPDVILLDLGLPDSQGLETFTKVNAQAPEVPIVVLTGLNDTEQATRAVKAGAQDYLIKGEVSGSLLVRAIRYAMERKQAEQALCASEARFKSLVETQSDLIARSDLDGRLTFVNDAYCKTFGKTREELLGKLFIPTVSPEDMPTVTAMNKAIQSPPHHMQTETRHPTPAGIRWFSWDNAAVLDESGKVQELQGIGRDITDVKQAEESLRESEERFRSLYENATIGIYRTTPEGQILMANPALVSMLGYKSLDDLSRRDLTKEGYEPEYPRHEFQQHIEQDGEVRGLESAWKRKDGAFIYVRESARLVRDEKNQPLYYEGTVEDISERKRAEDLLKESTEQLHEAQKLAHLGVWDWKPDTDTVTWTEELYHIAGLDPLLPAPTYKEHPNLYTPESWELLKTGVEKALETGESYQFELELIRPNGESRHVNAFGGAKFDFKGQVNRLFGTVQDITERKRAEEKLKEYSEHLEEMVEERTRELHEAQEQLVRKEKLAVMGQLAGSVGHELRNPLGVINTAIYYLKTVQPEAGGKIKRYHAMIEQEVHNADKIITDLLDFARGVTAERKPVSIPELVQRVIERFPVPASVEVKLEIPADLPMAFADPRQVEQVLGNLVVNAYQAMASQKSTGTMSARTGSATGVATSSATGVTYLAGTISTSSTNGGKLVIRAKPSSVNGQSFVVIAVKDTGTGIPPENMPKLFEPLFTTKAKGIGLGLAVSRKLAEANGGWIEVESEVGRGSTFTLVLPVVT